MASRNNERPGARSTMPTTNHNNDNKSNDNKNNSNQNKKRSLSLGTTASLQEKLKVHNETTAPNLDKDLNPETINEQHYRIERSTVLGTGAFTTFYKSVRKLPAPPIHLAVKVIRYDKVPPEWKEDQLKEEL